MPKYAYAYACACAIALSGCVSQNTPRMHDAVSTSGGTTEIRVPAMNEIPMSASGIDFATQWTDPIAVEKTVVSTWSDSVATIQANTGSAIGSGTAR